METFAMIFLALACARFIRGFKDRPTIDKYPIAYTFIAFALMMLKYFFAILWAFLNTT